MSSAPFQFPRRDSVASQTRDGQNMLGIGSDYIGYFPNSHNKVEGAFVRVLPLSVKPQSSPIIAYTIAQLVFLLDVIIYPNSFWTKSCKYVSLNIAATHESVKIEKKIDTKATIGLLDCGYGNTGLRWCVMLDTTAIYWDSSPLLPEEYEMCRLPLFHI